MGGTAVSNQIAEQEYRLASLWHRGAISLEEETLSQLKAALFDPTAGPADLAAIRRHTERLSQFEQLQGDALAAEFESWRRADPLLTQMIVRAQAKSDRDVLHALWQRFEEVEK
jgi:hypothetical protein